MDAMQDTILGRTEQGRCDNRIKTFVQSPIKLMIYHARAVINVTIPMNTDANVPAPTAADENTTDEPPETDEAMAWLVAVLVVEAPGVLLAKRTGELALEELVAELLVLLLDIALELELETAATCAALMRSAPFSERA